jgi:virginiamycin B lyase
MSLSTIIGIPVSSRASWLALMLGISAAASAQSVNFSEHPITTPYSQPQFIKKGPDGAIWFTETAGNNVGRITTVVPDRIAAGPDGALVLPSYAGSAIGWITTSGVLTEYPVTVQSQRRFQDRSNEQTK